MKLKYIIPIVASLIFIILVYNFINPKSSQYVIDYEQEEITWIEDHVNKNIFYYLKGDMPDVINEIIVTLELQMHVDFVESTDSEIIEAKNGIFFNINPIKHDGIETRTINTNTYGIYSNDMNAEFNYNELNSLGLLKSDINHIDFKSKYSNFIISYHETKEELMNLVNQDKLDFFAMSNNTPLIFHQEFGQFKEITKLFSKNENLRVYLNHDQVVLKNILNKNIDYMKKHKTIENIQLNRLVDKQLSVFNDLLTVNENTWLESTQKIVVGIEEHSPEVIKKENKLFGIAIGILNKIGGITDKKIEFIFGETDKLMSEAEDYNIDLIWTSVKQNEFAESLPFVESNYVVVGIGNNYDINTKYDLQQYKVGMIFNNELSDELSKILGKSNISYYNTEEELITALQNNMVDLVVTSELVLNYYETIEGLSELDIRYTFDDMYKSSLIFINNNPDFKSLINKAILVQNLKKLAITSFSNIPIAEDKGFSDWLIIAFIAFLGLPIIGMWLLKYHMNNREKTQMNYLFTHDQLTYLPNKYGVKQHVDSLIEKKGTVSILLIDIDNFKDVNDRLGHLYGDQVIVEYSQRLLGLLESNLILGRSGGDEFVLVSPTISDKKITSLVKQIKMHTENFQNEKKELYSFTVSITITKFPEHGNNYEDLYKYAEYTMDHVKNTYGHNSDLVFTYDIYDSYVQEQKMIKEIKQGIKNKEFILYIQPQILLPSEEVIGGEILVRWNHPTKGLLFPDTFIPVAEKNGLMRELDYYILFLACEQIKVWEKNYHPFKVSVNMSTTTFEDDSLINNIKAEIERLELDTSWLTIEVTEDMGFKNMEKANEIFKALRNLGISVALDDFGKGYSSLAYLEHLKFDVLKIDKKFVDNIHIKEESYKIFNAITSLAEIMNIKVVAEGVEYPEQITILNERMNIIVQGYFYSKPIIFSEFEKHIQNRQKK